MKQDIINSIILACLFLSLFGIAELLYYKTKMKGDDTRKVVHIGTGLLCMLFPVMLHSHWFVLSLCASFAVILYLSIKFNLLRSIHAIERVSHGSLLYPLAVYVCFLVYNHFQNNYLYFYIPLLTMAIADPVAAIFGKRWPYGRFHIFRDTKTLTGCSAFFLTSVIITLLLFHFLSPGKYSMGRVFEITIGVAGAATLTEAICVKGLDNLTIPLSVILILTLLHV